MHPVECPYCFSEHDIEALEPSFQRPDAFLRIPADERDHRTIASKDACAIRTADDSERTYFLRVLVPFTVTGLARPVSWGLWVEVSEQHFQRTSDLWDAPSQSDEPPFHGRIANALVGYKDAELIGLVSLSDPDHVPTFHLTSPADHQFVREQRTGVTPERVAEWLVPIYHPERLVQLAIDRKLVENAAARGTRWWKFW
jgi:hypothetical protein